MAFLGGGLESRSNQTGELFLQTQFIPAKPSEGLQSVRKTVRAGSASNGSQLLNFHALGSYNVIVSPCSPVAMEISKPDNTWISPTKRKISFQTFFTLHKEALRATRHSSKLHCWALVLMSIRLSIGRLLQLRAGSCPAPSASWGQARLLPSSLPCRARGQPRTAPKLPRSGKGRDGLVWHKSPGDSTW